MFGWLSSRQPRFLYLLFAATALAFATKESTFITLFIFGTFLILVLAWENATRLPVLRELRLGASSVDLRVRRHGDEVSLEVLNTRGHIQVSIVMAH